MNIKNKKIFNKKVFSLITLFVLTTSQIGSISTSAATGNSVSISNGIVSAISSSLKNSQLNVKAAQVAAWAPNTAYKVGDIVSYNGKGYKCIQAHTSLTGWEPSNVPALWGAVSGNGTENNSGSSNGNNNGGNTGGSNSGQTTQPAQPAKNSWPSQVFAPYVDVMLWPTFSINDCYSKTGQKYYTLAFVNSDNGGSPAWGGVTKLNDNFYANEINNIRSKGGDVIVSFGGANGTELAQSNTDVNQLQAKYQAVIDKYKLTYIDFDIEGAAVGDKASVDRRSKAIKGLQAANPNLAVAFCLPVLPSGLTDDGLYVLKSAKSAGVRIDSVNVMAMDFGDNAAPNPSGRMGDYAIKSAQSTYSQCSGLGISTKIGITPMIGVNDTQSEVFTQNDAKKLLSFAQSNNWVKTIAMWSVNRDNGKGGALYQSSNLPEADYDFVNVFKAFLK